MLFFATATIGFVGVSSPEFSIRYGMITMAMPLIAMLGLFVNAVLGSMEQQIKAQEQRIRILEQRQQAADAQLVRVATDPPYLPPSTDIQPAPPGRRE
jgi:hypothetical protein